MSGLEEILSMSTVLVIPAPKVPGPVFGVPIPVSVIPTEIDNPLVQVQVPAGMMIVSPATAVCVGPVMTALTSLRLQEAAV
jgi:hypothetical protein